MEDSYDAPTTYNQLSSVKSSWHCISPNSNHRNIPKRLCCLRSKYDILMVCVCMYSELRIVFILRIQLSFHSDTLAIRATTSTQHELLWWEGGGGQTFETAYNDTKLKAVNVWIHQELAHFIIAKHIIPSWVLVAVQWIWRKMIHLLFMINMIALSKFPL